MISKIEFGTIVADKLVSLVSFGNSDFAGCLKKHSARDILLLERGVPETVRRSPDHATLKYSGLRSIRYSNCEVVILNSSALLALCQKRFFWGSRIKTILIPLSLWILPCIPSALRYRRKKFLHLKGKTSVTINGRKKTFIVLGVKEKIIDNRHVFAPAHLSNSQILSLIDDLNYVLLRSVEKVEQDSGYKDIDLLIADADVQALHTRLTQEIGTTVIDAYSESGVGGHSYQSAPYFSTELARAVLESAETRPSGIKVPSEKWRYLALAFHLLFHGKTRHLPPGYSTLDAYTFGAERHLIELKKRAVAAGYPTPESLDALDAAIRDADIFPGRDLLGFYARRNPFIVDRYLGQNSAKAGLATFFVRDFGLHEDVVQTIRNVLQNEFEIVDEGAIDAAMRASVSTKVRGGNWNDRDLGRVAEPIYWFICHDPNPIQPTRKMKKKYPHLDNERVAMLKLDVRKKQTTADGSSLRVLHASDNADEALEHIRALGKESERLSSLQ